MTKTRLVNGLVALLLLVLVIGFVLIAVPAESSPSQIIVSHEPQIFITEGQAYPTDCDSSETWAVWLNKRLVFRVARFGSWPAKERAMLVAKRLKTFLAPKDRHEVVIFFDNGGIVLLLDQAPIITADGPTAKLNCISKQDLANTWAGSLRAGLGSELKPELPTITIKINPTFDSIAKLRIEPTFGILALLALLRRRVAIGALFLLLLALVEVLRTMTGHHFDIKPSEALAFSTIVAPILVASILVASSGVFTAVKLNRDKDLRVPYNTLLTHSMGIPKWDFSKSWASNITVLGATLGTVLMLTQQNLPKSQAEDRPALLLAATGLSILFGLLVLVAPVVYYALGHTKKRDTETKDNELQVEGYVVVFFFATLLTVWAVLGELSTISSVLNLLNREGLFLPIVSVVFKTGLYVSMLAVSIFAWRSIYWTVRYAIEAQGPRLSAIQTAMISQRQARGFAKARLQLRPQLPEWSLL